jgi:hypothetical protein
MTTETEPTPTPEEIENVHRIMAMTQLMEELGQLVKAYYHAPPHGERCLCGCCCKVRKMVKL